MREFFIYSEPKNTEQRLPTGKNKSSTNSIDLEFTFPNLPYISGATTHFVFIFIHPFAKSLPSAVWYDDDVGGFF